MREVEGGGGDRNWSDLAEEKEGLKMRWGRVKGEVVLGIEE